MDRQQFMEFFRDDETLNTLSVEDRVEVFSQVLIGSSDFTKELLDKVLGDYGVTNLAVIEDKVDTDNSAPGDAYKLFVNQEHVPFFPNGFTDWHETHFQVVELMTSAILESYELETDDDRSFEHLYFMGLDDMGGRWEEALDITNAFEAKHNNTDWDTHEDGWHEEVESFIMGWCKDKLALKKAESGITK